jgi:hypothetical protein
MIMLALSICLRPGEIEGDLLWMGLSAPAFFAAWFSGFVEGAGEIKNTVKKYALGKHESLRGVSTNDGM